MDINKNGALANNSNEPQISGEDIINIAKVCHQANKAWCETNSDFSQKDWEDAEQWQKESAISGVKFKIENPNAGHDAQHNSWMAQKISEGWVYGEVKDAEKKTHPCIVPFEQLPEFQQKKDALFVSIVEALVPKSIKEQQATELTYGEKAVGITFNPSNSDKVHQIKSKYAEIINLMAELKKESGLSEAGRLSSVAITEAQTAQMWAVKAITWKD